LDYSLFVAWFQCGLWCGIGRRVGKAAGLQDPIWSRLIAYKEHRSRISSTRGGTRAVRKWVILKHVYTD
jgi:hypothetical protein